MLPQRCGRRLEPHDQVTERTEVLTELWDDIATAYEA